MVVVAGAANQLASPSTSTVAGKSVTAWMADSSGQGDIFAMIDSGSGTGKSTILRLVAATPGILRLGPAVAMNPAGTSFICTWVQRDSASDTLIYQVFNANGAAAGSPVTICTHASGVLSEPSVAFSSDGSFVFTWLLYNGTNHGLWG